MAIAGSLITSIFMGVLIVVAILVMTILLAVWTYRDATSKGLSGILWTLVVILVPSFIGLIVYLCVRYDAKKVTCSKCLQQVNGNSKYCSNCGQELIPVVEVSEEDEKFKKSQRNILIGFFSSLGVMVLAIILMIAFLMTSIVNIVDTAVGEIPNLITDENVELLSDLDELFGEEGIHVSVDGEEMYIKDNEGNNLLSVDSATESVDVNISAVKKLMDEYGIEYDDSLSDEEMKEVIEQLADELQDVEDSENLEDLKENLHQKILEYQGNEK